MSGPLSHLRILDLSRVLAGPWAAQNFADLGAEVIKVERPGSGDDTRAWGPPYLKDRRGQDTSESAYFLSANRGKKSVTIDISKAEGQKLVRQLASRCDILLENYKVGALQRYGLSYDDLKKENPKLIYCSITGFGQDGPYRDRAGYDFMVQGMGGLMSVTGERDELPGGGPQKVGVAVADLMTGMYATVAVLAALAHRERGGDGQHIDLALLDVQVAMLANQNLNYLTTGVPPQRMGNAHPNIVPYQSFKTSDGDLILAVGNDKQFAKFCEIANCGALAQDARFSGNAGRVAHRDILVPQIASMLKQRSTAAWLAALEAGGVPCGPVHRLDQVFDDAQVRHRCMKIDLPHPLAGSVPQVASPMRFSATPARCVLPPPMLGEHTQEVLKGLLGIDQQEIDQLRSLSVI